MIQMFVQQKSIAEIRKACDADGGRREDVRLLRDKVLSAVILSHREARHVRPDRRKRIYCRSGAEHVAKIQCIRVGKVMIHAHAELVVILA